MTTPIKSYEEIEAELEYLFVSYTSPREIIGHLIEKMKEKEAGLVERFANFVDKYNVDLMPPDELRKELMTLITSSKE